MPSKNKKAKLLSKVKEILVKKRDGTLEKFSKEKIKNALIKAGAPIKLASKISSKTFEWVKSKKQVKASDIDEKVFELTVKNSISTAYRFKEFATKKVIGTVREQFTRKDVARMLTCLFVIIQIYAFRTDYFSIERGLLVLSMSIIVSAIVLLLYVGKTDMWKHLLAGISVSFSLSVITALILGVRPEGILIATSAALPVSTMVNVLRA